MKRKRGKVNFQKHFTFPFTSAKILIYDNKSALKLFPDHDRQAWNRPWEDDGDPWWEKPKHLENRGDKYFYIFGHPDGHHDGHHDIHHDGFMMVTTTHRPDGHHHPPQVDPDDIEAARKFAAPGREDLKRDVRSALDSLISGEVTSWSRWSWCGWLPLWLIIIGYRSEGGRGSRDSEAFSERAEGAKRGDSEES